MGVEGLDYQLEGVSISESYDIDWKDADKAKIYSCLAGIATHKD